MHNVPSNANRDNAINHNKQDKTQICYFLYIIQKKKYNLCQTDAK